MFQGFLRTKLGLGLNGLSVWAKAKHKELVFNIRFFVFVTISVGALFLLKENKFWANSRNICTFETVLKPTLVNM